MSRLTHTLALAAVVALAAPAAADGIAWYGTWKDARAVARKTRRPILLLSAAPHCHNVSGIW